MIDKIYNPITSSLEMVMKGHLEETNLTRFYITHNFSSWKASNEEAKSNTIKCLYSETPWQLAERFLKESGIIVDHFKSVVRALSDFDIKVSCCYVGRGADNKVVVLFCLNYNSIDFHGLIEELKRYE